MFDENGMITKEQLKEMKERAKNNRGNFRHVFISFNHEDPEKIDHPEKCFDLLKKSFPEFFREAGFDRNNIDLMCALHLDKYVHYHVHSCFWEKEATIVNKKHEKYPYFRKKGKIPKPILMWHDGIKECYNNEQRKAAIAEENRIAKAKAKAEAEEAARAAQAIIAIIRKDKE